MALFFYALVLSLRASEPTPTPAAHVVLIIWDGMRPDFITPEHTPNLHALAQRGTFFANHHSVWPTTTEVNGAALATGVFPRRSGIVANREFRPEINPRRPVPTEGEETVRRGDELSGGHYLGAPTTAEIVRAAGFSTAIAGTKPIALLQDRALSRSPTPFSATIFAGKAIPASLLGPLAQALGPFPPFVVSAEAPKPYTDGNRWTTRALLESLWHDDVPRYSVLWLSDPDYPQHLTSPGHPVALAGIRDSDTNLGLVVAELGKRGVLDKTDLFVVSDHGFSTIERSVDPVKYFQDHGMQVTREFSAPPAVGETIYVNVGGASNFYVTGHDPSVIEKLVGLLQASDFAGPIFTRDALPGTFALRTMHIDSPGAADIVFSFRWQDGPNSNGTRGLIFAESDVGRGMHGTLSRFDIRNTLVAAGPHIRAGLRSTLPSGNLDVAPTILHLLGLTGPTGMDGRILAEALNGMPAAAEPSHRRLEASRSFRSGLLRRSITWQQYLQTTQYAGETYFDEGNASLARP